VKYPPVLHNKQSPHQTPGSFSIDLHYAKLGICARWDWDRYTRLATFLNLTPWELASLICLSHSACDTAQKRNKFRGPECMVLTLLEAQVLKNFSADIIPKPFPTSLPHDPPQGSQA
jgi:hypothetical protein